MLPIASRTSQAQPSAPMALPILARGGGPAAASGGLLPIAHRGSGVEEAPEVHQAEAPEEVDACAEEDAGQIRRPTLNRWRTVQVATMGHEDEPCRRQSGNSIFSGICFQALIREHGANTSIHDRYSFGCLLGDGAAGSTWEATPKLPAGSAVCHARGSRESRRAVKKMNKHCIGGSQANLMEEVRLLKELDHPNICHLFEVFEDANAIYLVMDLCDGGELFNRIEEDGLAGESQASCIVRQIAQALRYCHEVHGIMHRDVKPENVLFVSRAPEAPVKLIDFGIACHFQATDTRQEQVGTEAYSAPEVLAAEAYTEMCDTWSLGALLYVILSGFMPFTSTTEALRGHFSLEDEHWAHVSEPAKDLIRRLLVVDPAVRLSAAQALEHPWLVMPPEEHSKTLPAQVLLRLKRFSDASSLRKFLLTVFSRHIDTNDLPEMYETFTTMDTDGDGMLSAEELRRGLDNVASKLPPGMSLDLFEDLDTDGSGLICYSEFLAAAIDRKLFFREDLCLQVFHTLDTDHTGTISVEELRSSMSEACMCEFLGVELQNDIIEGLSSYDADGDGVLNFHEFMSMLTENHVESLKSKGLAAIPVRSRPCGIMTDNPASFAPREPRKSAPPA